MHDKHVIKWMLMDNKYQQNQTVVSRQDMETWYSKDTVTH